MSITKQQSVAGLQTAARHTVFEQTGMIDSLPVAVSEIKRLHDEILDAVTTSVEKATRIGGLLIEIKASLGHGLWLPWIKANVPFTTRTAGNYMRLYEERDWLKLETVSDLTDCYRLLAARNPSRRSKSANVVGVDADHATDYELKAEATTIQRLLSQDRHRLCPISPIDAFFDTPIPTAVFLEMGAGTPEPTRVSAAL